MKKKLQTFLLVGLFAIGNAFAQNKIITGKVTGADDGLPLPGVSVIMKGTNKGTQTDADGKYTISVPPEAVLIFSYLGYIRQEVPTENLTTISISLRPETTELAEVKIVVPYGTATKKTYTGSAAVISGPDMAKRQVSDFTKALEGVAPGIQVTSSSGQPGTGAGIRIRGFNSINANMDPLYVVDGVPYNGDISAINTTDIESITALKDAASASLYGARAANGVILITTKKGKEGEPNLDVSARFGVNSIGVRQYDILTSPKDYYETAWKAIKQEALFRPNNPLSETDAAAYASENLIPKLGYNNYNVLNNQLIDPTTGKLNPAAQLLYHDDWGKESFKPQLRQEYNTSLSGLKDKTNYYMSFGYLKDKGYVVKSDFERFTTRLKLHQKVNNWLNTDLNLSYSNSKSNLSQTDNDAYQNFFSFARNVAPIYPVYLRDANDNYVYDKNGKRKYDFGAGEMGIRTYAGTENPLATLALDQDELKSGSFSGKTFAEISGKFK